MNTRPTANQIAWHDREIGMFIHFGLYSYRERDAWALPGNPEIFYPIDLDPRQWTDVALSLGAQYIVFTAKHADGFCNWQTETTDFGVKSSPWRNGKGDVVDEISRACAEAGIDFGIYLSPADAHFGASVGGRTADASAQEAYDRVYRIQLTELLTRYGEMCEVWFDGSCVTEVGDILEQHAPNAMVFQSRHATIRWVGNEAGFAPYPAWNGVSVEDGRSGMATAAHGDPDADLWLPLEVDTTIRDHYWMWERDTEDSLKSLDDLMSLYYRSVGHGAVLLLNSNPDRSGLIPDRDSQRASEFGTEIRRRFSAPVASRFGSGASTTLDLEGAKLIDHVVSMEEISGGEVVREYVIEGLCDGSWQELAKGTSIGHKKIDFFPPIFITEVRLRVLSAKGEPIIKELAAYACGVIPEFDRNDLVIHDPFFLCEWPSDATDLWTSEFIDIRSVCANAKRYTCSFRPHGAGEIKVVSVELFHEGTRIDGYVSPTRDPYTWHVTITANDSDYSVRFTIKPSGTNDTGGRIYIR